MNEKEAEELLIKQKVDEATKEAWDVIMKKASEAGVESDSNGLWLFFSRVNNIHFAVLNAPRLKGMVEDIL